jgi:hypothetical protein
MFAKKMTIALMGSVFLLASVPSEAALGRASSSSSSSKSSFSSGSSSKSSFSSPSNSSFTKSAPSQSVTQSGGGISQKQTLGVARTDVTNNIRNGTNVAPSNNSTVAGSNYNNSSSYNRGYNNSPSYNGGYNNGYYANQSQGHSTGALVGAAAAGAAVGYLAGNSGHNNGTTIINNGTSGYPNGGSVVYENGVPMNSTSVGASTAVVSPVVIDSSSSGISFLGGLWWLIKLIIAILVLFFLIKLIKNIFFSQVNNSESGDSMPIFTQTVSAETQLRDIKEKFFTDFQKNNRPSGLSFIRANTTDALYEPLEDLVKQTDENRVIKVKNLEAKLENIEKEGSRYVATVSYKAKVLEGVEGSLEETTIDEFWNFIYVNGSWKLNGIEQR